MFIAVLFIIVQKYRQSKCPSTKLCIQSWLEWLLGPALGQWWGELMRTLDLSWREASGCGFMKSRQIWCWGNKRSSLWQCGLSCVSKETMESVFLPWGQQLLSAFVLECILGGHSSWWACTSMKEGFATWLLKMKSLHSPGGWLFCILVRSWATRLHILGDGSSSLKGASATSPGASGLS